MTVTAKAIVDSGGDSTNDNVRRDDKDIEMTTAIITAPTAAATVPQDGGAHG